MTDQPYSVDRGSRRTERWLLTNVEWHPTNTAGVDLPCFETGVRLILDGEVRKDTFRLIQHGWPDFEAANDLIIRCLEKGWPFWRVEEVMTRLRERGTRPVFAA